MTTTIFKLDKESMRLRFHECMREFTALKAKAQPLRDKYTKLNVEIERLLAEQKKFSDKFLAIEAPCADLTNEAAMISRALGGKTGEAEGW